MKKEKLHYDKIFFYTGHRLYLSPGTDNDYEKGQVLDQIFFQTMPRYELTIKNDFPYLHTLAEVSEYLVLGIHFS